MLTPGSPLLKACSQHQGFVAGGGLSLWSNSGHVKGHAGVWGVCEAGLVPQQPVFGDGEGPEIVGATRILPFPFFTVPVPTSVATKPQFEIALARGAERCTRRTWGAQFPRHKRARRARFHAIQLCSRLSPWYCGRGVSFGFACILTANVIASISPQSGDASPRFFMSSLRSS